MTEKDALEQLKFTLQWLDFQRIVDWLNLQSQSNPEGRIASLSDEEFNLQAGPLVQSQSHQVYQEIHSLLPHLSNDNLLKELQGLCEVLLEWSQKELNGEEVYSLAGFWSQSRRHLLSMLC